MDEKDFVAIGVYDPSAPDAADRLELLQWLAGRGITLEQMAARGSRGLSGLAGDLALRPGARITAREIAAKQGMRVEDVLSLSLAAGHPPQEPDDPAFTADDVTLFAAFQAGASLFGESGTRRFTRVVGSSLARIAEAAVSLFQVEVEQPMMESGGSELSLAKRNLQAVEQIAGVRFLMQSLFGTHVETAIRRLREARVSRSIDTVSFAVGFVDLVGFTTVTQSMASRDLATLVERFEETAYEVVAQHDGRLVKLIGDEVMFVTREAAAACGIALTLFERFAGDGAVTPRGAIAYGEMLVRGGDYYGPVVNLASRVAQIAVPNELLVTSEVAARAEDGRVGFEPAGKRLLKGFEQPVALLTASRASR